MPREYVHDAPDIAVIIPTIANRARAAGLRRALDSVHAQQGIRTTALIVVNGPQIDRNLVRELAQLSGVRVIENTEPSLPNALAIGRSHVETTWFAELDDDDELLPCALRTRLDAMEDADAIDAVISNGFIQENGARRLHVPSWSDIEPDPLRALLSANWLRPGAGLFRSSVVTEKFFSGMPRYLERTYLALRLVARCRLRFLGAPTFIYNADTPGSVSKSREYELGLVGAIDQLLELKMPEDVERGFRWRRTVSCNSIANLHLREGNLDTAWRWHLRTLRGLGGWRYLLGMRRFIGATLLSTKANR